MKVADIDAVPFSCNHPLDCEVEPLQVPLRIRIYSHIAVVLELAYTLDDVQIAALEQRVEEQSISLAPAVVPQKMAVSEAESLMVQMPIGKRHP